MKKFLIGSLLVGLSGSLFAANPPQMNGINGSLMENSAGNFVKYTVTKKPDTINLSCNGDSNCVKPTGYTIAKLTDSEVILNMNHNYRVSNNIKNYIDSEDTDLKNYIDSEDTDLKNYVDSEDTDLKNYVDSEDTDLKNYVDGIKGNVDSDITDLKNYVNNNSGVEWGRCDIWSTYTDGLSNFHGWHLCGTLNMYGGNIDNNFCPAQREYTLNHTLLSNPMKRGCDDLSTENGNPNERMGIKTKWVYTKIR